MTERLEVCGASGQAYIYSHLPDGMVPPFQGANLVLAERRGRRWRVLETGVTDYLPRRDWRGLLEEVRKTAPRAQLFYRLNVAHAVRAAEAEDIRALQRMLDASEIAA
jgi:hypothetical protein